MNMPKSYHTYCAAIKNDRAYMGRGIDFLSLTTWLNIGPNEDRLFDESCDVHAPCAIVGTVAAQNLHIDACGDFTPSMDIRDSRITLTLQRPSALHPNFREDWDTSIKTLSTLANTLCDNAKTTNLIVEQNGDVVLTFAKAVFREKVAGESCDWLKDAAELPVEPAYKHLLTPLSGKYYYNVVRVYGRIRPGSPIWFYDDRMEGRLVQLNFKLIYSASEGLHAEINSVRMIAGKDCYLRNL